MILVLASIRAQSGKVERLDSSVLWPIEDRYMSASEITSRLRHVIPTQCTHALHYIQPDKISLTNYLIISSQMVHSH